MTDGNSDTPDLARSVALIRARWKTILVVCVVVLAAAFGYVQIATPIYQATAHVSYQSPPQGTDSQGLPASGDRHSDMDTLAAAADDYDIANAAAKKLGTTQRQLASKVKVQVDGDTSILDITARTTSATQAAKIANVYASSIAKTLLGNALNASSKQIAMVKSELKELGPVRENDPNLAQKTTLAAQLNSLQLAHAALSTSLKVSDRASVPTAAVWPRRSLTLLAALLVGLGIGCGVALLTASADRKLRIDNIDALPAPVIVQVPSSAVGLRGTSPMNPSAVEPIVADAYAALGARVMLDKSGDSAHVVLITSARASEGKSTTAANLASALARSGRRVILVDADMRRPTQDIVFPILQARPGLSDLLGGIAQVEQALTLVEPNLAVIASGPRQVNASLLLTSVAFRSLLERLGQISEAVIVDAPPTLPVTDALAVASMADQVLTCARIDVSDVEELQQAHARLASSATTPQAIVLIGTARPVGYDYGGTRMAESPAVRSRLAASSVPPIARINAAAPTPTSTSAPAPTPTSASASAPPVRSAFGSQLSRAAGSPTNGNEATAPPRGASGSGDANTGSAA